MYGRRLPSGLVYVLIIFGFTVYYRSNIRGFLMAASKLGNPIVTIRQGTFIGTTSYHSHFPQILDIFLGIPYALAPTGERRFRLPVRVPASSETFSSAKWGPTCPIDPVSNPCSEDCLNLNVFRPRERDVKRKLPVLVYIHGGAFNFGAGRWTAISSFVAWSPEPIIGISFNYRIGALGFLPSKAAAKEGSLNLGLRDQWLLLEWVKENVPAFGGDENDVTIMGASAGAHSIGHHIMASTDKAPLFHKAIMDSGAPTARVVHSYDSGIHQEQFNDFLKETGCTDVPEDRLMSHLRTLPVSTIASASVKVYQKYSPSLRWAFQPVIEGAGGYISKAPIDGWRTGNYHKIPILTGFNTNEGATFVPSSMSTSSQFRQFFHTLLPNLSISDLDTLEELYPDPILPFSPYKETRPGLGAQFKRIETAYAHWAYISGVRQTVHYASESSLASIDSKPKPPAFLYHFAVNRTHNGGANHGDEGEYVTHTPNVVKFTRAQKKIAGYMHAYWASFVISGDPNAVKGYWPDRPHWPVYEARPGGYGEKILFGEGNDEWTGGGQEGIAAQVVSDTWAKNECEFWWSVKDRTFKAMM